MTRISDDERAYHVRVLEAKKAADIIWNAWAAHLAEKYELGGDDSIDATGGVHRRASRLTD